MQNTKSLLLITSALLLAACGGDSNNSSENKTPPLTGSSTADYEICFVSLWNSTDFPTNFPGNPHFSPLIGAAHNDQITFWQTSGPATAGIEQMAETGGVTKFRTEIQQAINAQQAREIINGPNIGSASGQSCAEARFDDNNTLLTITSMIAPSPDWFVGLSALNLKENGQWVTTKKIDARLYDAGTDGGLRFSSTDDEAGREDVISRLNSLAADTDFSDGVHRTNGKFLGYFAIDKIE